MEFKRVEIAGNRVTLEEVEAAILKVEYAKMGSKITIAHITLVDGFEVIGKSGVVDPSKYDEKIGGEIALTNALGRVWEHMGSILQDRLLEKERENE